MTVDWKACLAALGVVFFAGSCASDLTPERGKTLTLSPEEVEMLVAVEGGSAFLPDEIGGPDLLLVDASEAKAVGHDRAELSHDIKRHDGAVVVKESTFGVNSTAADVNRRTTESILRSAIIPQLDFEDATVQEALEYLRVKAIEYGGKRAVGVSARFSDQDAVINPPVRSPPSSTKHELVVTSITLSRRNISVWDALQLVMDQSGLRFTIDEWGRPTVLPR